MTNPSITPEITAALRVLREQDRGFEFQQAMDVLDKAGFFAAIDEVTGYDVDPEPVRVSRCTCPGGTWSGQKHLTGCPGDTA